MTTAQTTSPLDPGGLAKNVTAQVSTALMSQARALVVARQQDAAAYIEDPELAVRTRESQEELNRDVTFYLNRVLPEVAGRLSDASSAAAFIAALAATTATDEGAQAPEELLGATLAQFEQYRAGAAELADTLTATAHRAAARGTALEEALDLRIEELKGGDGEIQSAKDAITQTRDAIEQDLKDLVTAADEIGSGIKTWLLDKVKVVTGILSSFGGGDDEQAPSAGKGKGKSKDKAKSTDKAKPTKAKADDDEDDEDETPAPGKKFDVAGLDVDVDRTEDDGTDGASQGATELGAAAASFRRHNTTLAELYQTLARLKAELAVAAAVRDQAAGFAASLTSASAAANALAGTWQAVLDAAAPLLDLTDPAKLAVELAAAVTKASGHWSSLAKQTDYARAAMAGKSGAIPDVGVLPTADDDE